jgi:transcriptional regulator GlxA family with amidase domain
LDHVIIIVPDGGLLAEPLGMAEILTRLNLYLEAHGDDHGYKVSVASTQRDRYITDIAGRRLQADIFLGDADPHVKRELVIVSGMGTTEQEAILVSEWLKIAAKTTSHKISVCGGAFMLAKAGLLSGKKATTHWRLLNQFQDQYPDIDVVSGPFYIHDDDVWTSAGVNGGFDLVLSVIEQRHGQHIASILSDDMVTYFNKPYVPHAHIPVEDAQKVRSSQAMKRLVYWIAGHLNHNLKTECLAQHVAMSPRNFSRVFVRETGLSPAKFVEQARLRMTKQLLQQSDCTMQQIADICGFGSVVNMRRCFERHLGMSPSEYRDINKINLPT